MKRRRRFSGDLKAKVALEAFRGYCQVKWNSRVLEVKSVGGRT